MLEPTDLHESARGGGESPDDLGGAMIRNGVRISVQTAGPYKTMKHLAIQLRQLSEEFPNAWMVARVAAFGWVTPKGESPRRTGPTDSAGR
jgi:hypothetical protein